MYPLQDAAIHGNRLFSGLLMYDYQKKGAENSFNHCNFLARKYQSYHPITI